jgi:hypothetical protein
MARAKRPASKVQVPSVADEFEGAELGDARRSKRLLKFAAAFSEAPDRSLPEIARDAAELEAIYRFVENGAFGFAEMLGPHFGLTGSRIEAAKATSVLVIHDISECAFSLEHSLREGFAKLSKKTQGFRLECSLAVSADGLCQPFGLLHTEAWTGPRGRTVPARWDEFVSQSRSRAPRSAKLIHVIDREAGMYELFHRVLSGGDGFLIRMTKDRVAEFEELRGVVLGLQEAAEVLESVHEVPVPLSLRRRELPDPRNPAREARLATLSFSAAPIVLKKPDGRAKKPWLPDELHLNLVCVTEKNPPAGEAPVQWFLATTEPIATAAQITSIVNMYRARWMIEEFFKALKTGCALASRQVESFDAMLKVLAISLVVAWRSLLLRHESRRDPDAAVSVALTPTLIEILRVTGRVPLSDAPTNKEALFAVAALGGFIKNNRVPGWRVIARGMERLLEREIGWVSRAQK